MYKEKKRTTVNIIFSILGMIINYGINFVLTPYILRNLGSEAYGFTSLSTTMVNYLIVITGALNSYACFSISYEYHKMNYKRANGFFSSLFIANVILALIIFVIGCLYVKNVQVLLNISNSLVYDVKIIFMLVLINYMISILGTPFSISTFIKNRLDLSSICNICGYFINSLGIICLFIRFAPKIWYMSLIAIAVSIFTLGCNILFTKYLTPELKINHKFFSLSYIIELLKLGIWSSIGRMGLILSDGLDILITNLMLDGITMGQVSLAKVVPTMAYNVIYQISVTFQPTQVRLWAENKKEELIKDLKESMIIIGIFSNIIFCGFCSIGRDFLNLWVPTENIQFIFELTFLGMVGSVLVGAVYPLVYTNALSKRLKGPCIVNLISGFTNVVFMYILLKITCYGAYIIVGTSAFLSIIVHYIYVPIHSANNLKVKWYIFYYEIVKSLIACGITLGVFKTIRNHYVPNSWGKIFLIVIFLSMIGLLINFVFITNKNQKKKIIYYINSKINH